MRNRLARERRLTHGGSGTTEHGIWSSAKDRCFNPANRAYKFYGGRGITMCNEWRSDFSAFLKYMGPKPTGFTLDRINSNGNYEPGNCRWADRTTQGRNRRGVLNLTINGETKLLCDWLAHFDIGETTYYKRVKAGMTSEQALTAKRQRKKKGQH